LNSGNTTNISVNLTDIEGEIDSVEN